MQKFVKFFLMAFGALLFWQVIIRIPYEQRYRQRTDVGQVSGRTLRVLSPDLFAEKNIFETFRGRYKAQLAFTFRNDADASLPPEDAAHAVLIYPSFAFAEVQRAARLAPIDPAQALNLANLADSYRARASERYGCGGMPCAVPVAWVPWALFADAARVNPTASGKPYFTGTRGWKIAVADRWGSSLALARIFGLAPVPGSAAALAALLPAADLRWFDPDDPADVSRVLRDEEPPVVLGPSYLKSLISREGGKHEMFLPEEGTYATLYLLSATEGPDLDLAVVFLNHLTDPTIHKNLATVMTVAIPNRLSQTTLEPVLASALRLTDPSYEGRLLVLEDAAGYAEAQALHRELRSLLAPSGR